MYRDVIEKNRQEKEKLLFECDDIHKQIHIENKRIDQLEKILSDSSMLHVKQLSIVDAQEKERQRIARDLHDTSLQFMIHILYNIKISRFHKISPNKD